ncbi:MAG TPA: hypothetical protein VNA69_14120 [Thermoanaerobaculia bacterium]|nr:hypothetical protein [Thermoanaerobaculia bacterium]
MRILTSALQLLDIADITTVLAAVVVVLVSFILQSTNSRRSASGYVWPALLLSKARLAAWIAIKTVLAVAILHAARLHGSARSIQFLLALLVTAAPEVIEAFAPAIRNEKIARFVFVAMQRTNFSVIQLLNAGITRLREHANYDWQNRRGQWDFGVSAEEVGRRIRILYERNKREIANSLRKPGLLAFDAGIVPAQKFYLLIDFLGLRRLNDALHKFSGDPATPPTFGWDGSERRRTQVSDHPARRPIDDPHLCRLISLGQAFPAYNTSPTASVSTRTKKS